MRISSNLLWLWAASGAAGSYLAMAGEFPWMYGKFHFDLFR
jgi:hypothetical protein